MMTKKTNSARISRAFIFVALILGGGLLQTARAGVTPTVCVISNPRSGTTTLTSNVAVGGDWFTIDSQGGTISPTIRVVINPGGANEETFSWASYLTSGYWTRRSGVGSTFQHAHNAGEPVQWSTDHTAVWGYNNTNNATVNIPRGISTFNYFTPLSLTYASQPNQFLPGIHTAFSFDFPTRDNLAITWILDGGTATASKDAPACATVTYQGRLTDAGAAANGQYDLRFVAYDALTGGMAQGDSITVENAQVTNGVFTVQLNFYSVFTGNPNAKYLEIAVRPGASSGSDPFTVLTPRQPITYVPYAVNAQFATKAVNAANATQFNGLSTSSFVRNDVGSNTIGGNVQVNGDIGVGTNLIVTGYVKLGLTVNAPPAADCDAANEHGRMKADATNNLLYICTATGWKSVALQ